jgi:hypothetical protein
MPTNFLRYAILLRSRWPKYVFCLYCSSLCAEDVQKACSFRARGSDKYELPQWASNVKNRQQYRPSHNVAPTDVTPVLVPGSHFSGEADRMLQPMMWGMVPLWHKVLSTCDILDFGTPEFPLHILPFFLSWYLSIYAIFPSVSNLESHNAECSYQYIHNTWDGIICVSVQDISLNSTEQIGSNGNHPGLCMRAAPF